MEVSEGDLTPSNFQSPGWCALILHQLLLLWLVLVFSVMFLPPTPNYWSALLRKVLLSPNLPPRQILGGASSWGPEEEDSSLSVGVGG